MRRGNSAYRYIKERIVQNGDAKMAKDINKSNFEESTILKLNIFAECFKEWLPVFIYDRSTPEVFVFDFFAGSGTDNDNNFGSPLLLFNIAKGKNYQYCKNVNKPIRFIFNEKSPTKAKSLSAKVMEAQTDCRDANGCQSCSYQIEVRTEEFQKLFNSSEVTSILSDRRFGKFLLMDQYGFKETNEEYNKRVGFVEKQVYKFNSSKIYLSENVFQSLKNEEHIFSTEKDENILLFNFKDLTIPCEKGIPQSIKNRTPYMIVIDIKEVFLAKYSYSKQNNKYSLINGSFIF